MALIWASSMGEVHRPGTTAGSEYIQMLRYFGEQSAMSSSTAAGLMSKVVMQDGQGRVRTPQFTEQDTWIVQAAYRATGPMDGGLTQDLGIVIRRQGTEQLRLSFIPASASGSRFDGEMYSVRVERGATVLAATDPIFYSREWVVFQFKVTIDPAAGAYEVKAMRRENESFTGSLTTILSGSGVNTADDGVTGADQFQFNYYISAGASLWDHVWVMDDTGALNNDFPGKFLLVQGVIPNANGAQLDWISQGGQGSGATFFDALNDSASNIAGDVGRAVTENIGDIILMAFQVPGETGLPGFETGPRISSLANVPGMIFHHVSAMENSGTLTVRPVYRNISDVRAEGNDLILTSTSFQGFYEVFEQNPVSAAAWTALEAIQMQWGLKLQA